MPSDARTSSSAPSATHRTVLLLAAIATYFLVTLGGTVCITGSTYGCPDWPACFGRAVPPARVDSIIEYTHRLTALLAAPLVLWAALLGRLRTPALRWVSRPPMVAVGLFIAVSIFGAFAVLTGLPVAVAALDIGSALLALGLMVTAALVARAHRARPSLPDRLRVDDGFARAALATAGAVFAVLVTGVVAAQPGSIVRCLAWPAFDARALAVAAEHWLPTLRHVVTAATSVAILGLVVQAWRNHDARPDVARVATTAGVLLIAALGLGFAVPVEGGSGLVLPIAWVAVTAALWVAVVALAVTAALPAPATVAAAGLARATSQHPDS